MKNKKKFSIFIIISLVIGIFLFSNLATAINQVDEIPSNPEFSIGEEDSLLTGRETSFLERLFSFFSVQSPKSSYLKSEEIYIKYTQTTWEWNCNDVRAALQIYQSGVLLDNIHSTSSLGYVQGTNKQFVWDKTFPANHFSGGQYGALGFLFCADNYENSRISNTDEFIFTVSSTSCTNPSDEVCDGEDNNCNGETDELDVCEQDCVPNVEQRCYIDNNVYNYDSCGFRADRPSIYCLDTQKCENARCVDNSMPPTCPTGTIKCSDGTCKTSCEATCPSGTIRCPDGSCATTCTVPPPSDKVDYFLYGIGDDDLDGLYVNKVNPGDTVEIAFGVQDLGKDGKDTTDVFVEAAIYTKQYAIDAGHIQSGLASLYGRENIYVAANCEPKEEFVDTAKITVENGKDAVFILKPKAPTLNSKFGDGSSNWAGYGEYVILVGLYEKCEEGYTLSDEGFNRRTEFIEIISEGLQTSLTKDEWEDAAEFKDWEIIRSSMCTSSTQCVEVEGKKVECESGQEIWDANYDATKDLKCDDGFWDFVLSLTPKVRDLQCGAIGWLGDWKQETPRGTCRIKENAFLEFFGKIGGLFGIDDEGTAQIVGILAVIVILFILSRLFSGGGK